MAEAFAKSPLFDIMKKSPGAVAALKEAGEIAKKKGQSRFLLTIFLRAPLALEDKHFHGVLTKPYNMLCLSSCPLDDPVGVDMTSPPSKMTMMSLAFDSEFRGAIEKVRLRTLPSFFFFFTILDVYSSFYLSSYCCRIAHVVL
jgi:hypothetical protein